MLVQNQTCACVLFEEEESSEHLCVSLQATAMGANSQAAQSILKTDYSDALTLESAKKLAVKVLKKTMDSTVMSPEKIELAEIIRRRDLVEGVQYRTLSKTELQTLCADANTI